MQSSALIATVARAGGRSGIVFAAKRLRRSKIEAIISSEGVTRPSRSVYVSIVIE